MTQTGRTAIAVGTWFRLRNQLAKRFYVAATSDGKKFAASSGESSLAVVNTQLSEPEEVPVGPAMAARIRQLRLQKLEVTTQDVSDLPGTISCVEIIQQGDVVLAGTEDGRLLARSCADLQDWDLYAQDLFAWQDEHRAATRISDTAVLVVKAINGERLLTVDANHVCRIWNIVDVV